MRNALVCLSLCGLGLIACGSSRPRAAGTPDGRDAGASDAGAGDVGDVVDAGDIVDLVDIIDAVASVDAVAGVDTVVDTTATATFDGPASPPGPRPVRPSPGCGKGNRTEGIHYIQSGGKSMLVTVRLPPGYDPDRPSPVGLAFPNFTYPQCTVQCRGFTEIDAVTLFPMTWTRDWNEPEEGFRANVLFFEDLVAFVKNDYCVDENRVFVAGAGMGARFVQQLACKHSDWLWQVTAISASAPHLDSTCQGKPAALVIHSVEDDGAVVAQAVVENLAARSGCSATPPPGLGPAREAMLAAYRANRPDARCVDWPGCTSPVRLCLVSNRFQTPGETIQGYRGWPTNGGALIGEFLDRLD